VGRFIRSVRRLRRFQYGPLWVAFGVLVVVFGYFAPGFAHHLPVDGYSYLFLAKAWHDGAFWAGISQYWSPLHPLVTTGLLGLGSPELLAPKLSALLGSGLLLLALNAWAGRWQLPFFFKLLLLGTAGIFLAVQALWLATPDAWAAAAWVWAIWAATQPKAPFKRRLLHAAGWLGVAYWAKAFFLPYGLVFMGGWWLVAGFIQRSGTPPLNLKRLFTTGLLGGCVFGLFVAFWVALLSTQAGELSFGASGRYNLHLVWDWQHQHPIEQQLTPPPHAYALAGWHDISEAPWWPPAAPPSFTLSAAMGVWRFNSAMLWRSLTQEPGLMVWLLLGLLVVLVARKRFTQEDRMIGATAGVLVAAYLVVITESRYLWGPMLLLGGWGLAQVGRLSPGKVKWAAYCLCVLVGGISAYQAWALVATYAGSDSDTHLAGRFIVHSGHAPPTPKVATLPGLYGTGQALAYAAGGRYFGCIPCDAALQHLDACVQTQMNTHHLDVVVMKGTLPRDKKRYGFFLGIVYQQVGPFTVWFRPAYFTYLDCLGELTAFRRDGPSSAPPPVRSQGHYVPPVVDK